MARTFSVDKDTLIGKNNIPVWRGIAGGWEWTAHISPSIERPIISVRRLGESTRITMDKVPNYVLAHIVRSISLEG